MPAILNQVPSPVIGGTTKRDTPKVKALINFGATPHDLDVVRITPHECLLNENLGNPFILFTAAPWIDINKPANGIPDHSERFQGPKL